LHTNLGLLSRRYRLPSHVLVRLPLDNPAVKFEPKKIHTKILGQRPDPALAAAGREGEWLVARVRLVVLTLLLITPTWKIIHYPTIPVFIWGFVATLIGAIAAVAIWTLLKYGQWRRWIGFVSSALDVSLITAALLSFAYVSGPLVALNSNVTFEIYFLAIAALALRYDTRICVTIGMLAVIEYAALWGTLAWRYDLGDPIHAIGIGEHNISDQATRLILLSAAVLLAYAYVRRAQHLLNLASRDRLTGVYNRGQFDVLLAHEIELAQRNGYALSMALLDLDHFKRVNDTLGHAAGDRVLIGIAERLMAGVRPTDVVARYGGEEFAVLFRETDRNAAAVRVELLRAQVAGVPLRVTDGREVTVTCSAGIAELRVDGDDAVVLAARADARLLAAKCAGRNRVYAADVGAQHAAPLRC
jgi:two-component system cell cycle response regulator